VGNKIYVGNPWEMLKSSGAKSPTNAVNTRCMQMQFQDEASHGKGFEGLLKRYFG